MAVKKYVSLSKLTEYHNLISDVINSGDGEAREYADSKLSLKADVEHSHNDKYYTESEIDAKLSTINTNVSNIVDGTTIISKASKDGNGNVIASTYETKTDANAKLVSAKDYADSVVASNISTHNTSTSAHSDIRGLISTLSTKVNNFLDVDETTTDQLSEVLALIAANKGTLESITSNKVNVSDIIDNLTTANAKKVLSANQGVELKKLIDALQTAVNGKAASVHSHDIDDVTGLQDALDAKATTANLNSHTGNTTVHITSTEKTNWNAAKTHADSTHAPTNAQANVIESIKVNGTAQTITSKSVNITVPTQASDIGAATAGALNSHTSNADIHFTATERTKLSGIATGATKVIVDTALNQNSANAISNKVVTDAISTVSNAALTNAGKISDNETAIANLQSKVGDGFEEITSEEIQNLFK